MDTYAPVSPKSTSSIPYVQTEAKAKATDLVNKTGASSIPRGENGVSSAPRNRTGGSSFIPDNGSPLDDFFESQTINSAIAHDIYVPNWNATNDAGMTDPVICRNFIDHAPPPGYWAFLCNQNNAEFLDHFNVSIAQHAYMMSELRLRYEHEITIREKIEYKFVKNSEIIQQRDSEVAALKSKLERLESESADSVTPRKRVFELETAAAAKSEELAGLNVQNAELLGKVSWLKLVCDRLKSQVTKLEVDWESLCGEVAGEAKMRAEFMSVQDAEAQRIAQLNAELDARIAELNHDMDTELYPHMLTVVAGRLEADIEHGKANRSLTEVEAYDSGVKAKYVAAVHELENVSFSLLDQLESLMDSHLELLKSSLKLEGDHGEEDPTLEFCKLQPVSDQVTMPVYYERGGSRDPGSISHEILLSDALAASHARGKKHKKVSLEIGDPSVAMPSTSS
ncbi:hypothetical protein Tco_0543166 [Tanacetum coccineum]